MSFILEVLKGTKSPIIGRFPTAQWNNVSTAFSIVEKDPFRRAMLAGIAWTESDFIPTARNKESGASGLMQIMPLHFDGLGWQGISDWSDPIKNIRAGRQIFYNSGWGVLPIETALANYGGFVTVDPSDYIKKVIYRATYMLGKTF